MPDDSSSDGEFDLPPSLNNKKRQNQFNHDVDNFESLGNYEDDSRTWPKHKERNSNLVQYDSNNSKNEYTSNQALF